MRIIFGLCFIFLTLPTFATSIAAVQSVQGTGNAGGFCSGDNFPSFCIRQVEDRARTESTRDADRQCRYKQGTLRAYSGSCYNSCNPSYISGGNQSVYVSCSSRCRFECDIRD